MASRVWALAARQHGWGILARERTGIEVSVPTPRDPRRPGIVAHRRVALGADDMTIRNGIPVTTPICTLVDIAARLTRDQLEAAINEADKRDLTNPETLRSALDVLPPRPGVANLRKTSTGERLLTPTQSWSAGSCRSLAERGFHRHRRGGKSTASGSTSTGRRST
jgi:AbiEi antitoxin C-terminal domain